LEPEDEKLICGACNEEILPKDAEYLIIGLRKILKPHRECRERLKKALESYPKNHGKKA
jgi:hypothetical protein